ncbi:MAG TPA: leucine-rich repeat domain-containing protein [Candidatus Baltobacteraceae bacterium]|nr:leucine-rich repeat domain-containing protein [Candidatus Baltobacteraceae bacterium]
MKRRYKRGDWLYVPLGEKHDAVGVIARMCRSRLFGYFFSVPAGEVPSHDALRALTAQDAIAAMLFGGAPLEDDRWHLIATSLGFDPSLWPLPDFASRGAFSESWTKVRYDPESLQIVERCKIGPHEAAALPDARFAGAHDAEVLLRRAIAGEPFARTHTVCEMRSPLDEERLKSLEDGGVVQFSTPLTSTDLDRLAAFIHAHPQVVLRVHGFHHGFDAAQLVRFESLRTLVLDAHRVQHAQQLRALRQMRSLRIGAARLNLDVLDDLTELSSLELRGTRAALAPVLRLPNLRSLVLEGTPPFDLRTSTGAQQLEHLVLAHGNYDAHAVAACVNLRDLRLRSLDIEEVPDLSGLRHLEALELHGLARVTDLRAIAQAPALRRLRVGAMPQLNVEHFAPLARCTSLRTLDVEVGSRQKEREIYRLWRAAQARAGALTDSEGRSPRRGPGT